MKNGRGLAVEPWAEMRISSESHVSGTDPSSRQPLRAFGPIPTSTTGIRSRQGL